MDFLLDEDIDLIDKMKKADIKEVLNRKKLSRFELDLAMND